MSRQARAQIDAINPGRQEMEDRKMEDRKIADIIFLSAGTGARNNDPSPGIISACKKD